MTWKTSLQQQNFDVNSADFERELSSTRCCTWCHWKVFERSSLMMTASDDEWAEKANERRRAKSEACETGGNAWTAKCAKCKSNAQAQWIITKWIAELSHQLAFKWTFITSDLPNSFALDLLKWSRIACNVFMISIISNNCWLKSYFEAWTRTVYCYVSWSNDHNSLCGLHGVVIEMIIVLILAHTLVRCAW